MTNEVEIREGVVAGGGRPFVLIAGPCVIESEDLCRHIAGSVKETCAALGIPYVFKASFDKANRTSGASFRGQGPQEGLEILARIRESFDLPVLTDVHEPSHCALAAPYVDILQIPAFLSRQTDLLLAAGRRAARSTSRKPSSWRRGTSGRR